MGARGGGMEAWRRAAGGAGRGARLEDEGLGAPVVAVVVLLLGRRREVAGALGLDRRHHLELGAAAAAARAEDRELLGLTLRGRGGRTDAEVGGERRGVVVERKMRSEEEEREETRQEERNAEREREERERGTQVEVELQRRPARRYAGGGTQVDARRTSNAGGCTQDEARTTRYAGGSTQVEERRWESGRDGERAHHPATAAQRRRGSVWRSGGGGLGGCDVEALEAGT